SSMLISATPRPGLGMAILPVSSTTRLRSATPAAPVRANRKPLSSATRNFSATSIIGPSPFRLETGAAVPPPVLGERSRQPVHDRHHRTRRRDDSRMPQHLALIEALAEVQ